METSLPNSYCYDCFTEREAGWDASATCLRSHSGLVTKGDWSVDDVSLKSVFLGALRILQKWCGWLLQPRLSEVSREGDENPAPHFKESLLEYWVLSFGYRFIVTLGWASLDVWVGKAELCFHITTWFDNVCFFRKTIRNVETWLPEFRSWLLKGTWKNVFNISGSMCWRKQNKIYKV